MRCLFVNIVAVPIDVLREAHAIVAAGDVKKLDALLRSHRGMLTRGTAQGGDLLVAAAAKGKLDVVRNLVRRCAQ